MALRAVVHRFSSKVRPTFCLLQKCEPPSKPVLSNIMISRCITISSSSPLYSGRKYSMDHEWILKEGDHGRIGITDYAQEKLGEIVFIDLPEVGDTFGKDESCGALESVKAASDVISPVSGEVTEVNTDLEASPETVNKDPYEAGWLIKVTLSKPSELDELMTEEEYEKYIQECD